MPDGRLARTRLAYEEPLANKRKGWRHVGTIGETIRVPFRRELQFEPCAEPPAFVPGEPKIAGMVTAPVRRLGGY